MPCPAICNVARPPAGSSRKPPIIRTRREGRKCTTVRASSDPYLFPRKLRSVLAYFQTPFAPFFKILPTFLPAHCA
ncbi:unnamed protein product [Caenorhabditis auriculariae]|uniref:Uncharacterized protein n=1 Tax=Caenorhabditis auriculariae TaxID=2777116 RepID=A0A8S1HGF7_9PELO|nr:unnamed protein product [Caenorhabditis auriculariae]